MKKKHIYILATGGTISAQGEEGKTLNYTNGIFKIDSILETVKGIDKIAKISKEQIFNISSVDMTVEKLSILAKRINELSKLDSIDGFVIVQGTDILEETAFFLNLVLKTDKPVVITGAMRPATANSADGPSNLYEAVVVAADKNAVGQGVLVVLANSIITARDVEKNDSFRLQAFEGKEFGYCGYVHDETVQFMYKSLKPHTVNSEFNVDDIKLLPKVGLLYFTLDLNPDILDYYVSNNYKGLVIAGAGSGSINKKWKNKLSEISAKSIHIVRSTIGRGSVEKENIDKECNTIPAYTLIPTKSRILLALALSKSDSHDYISDVFKKY